MQGNERREYQYHSPLRKYWRSLTSVQKVGIYVGGQKNKKRTGLNYHEFANFQVLENWWACKTVLAGKRLFAIKTKGIMRQSEIQFQTVDVFIFVPETLGLPEEICAEFLPEHRLRYPMLPNSHSLNLSNSAVVLLMKLIDKFILRMEYIF